MYSEAKTLGLIVRLALTGGKITIGPAPHSRDAQRLIEVRVEIPDGAGDSDGVVRIVGYGEIMDDRDDLLGREMWTALSSLAADRFLEPLPPH
jgi:hypothetical protein